MPQPAPPTISKWNVNSKKAEEKPVAEVGKSGFLDDTILDTNGSAMKDKTAFDSKSVISDYTVANTPNPVTTKA